MPFILSRAQNLMAMSGAAYLDAPDMSRGNFGRPGGAGAPIIAPIILFRSAFLNNTIVPIRPPRGALSDTEGFVVTNDRGDIVVAFRGSEPFGRRRAPTGGFIDWVLTDALAVLVPYPSDLALLTRPILSRPISALRAFAEIHIPNNPRMVHAGFLIAYANVRGQVIAAVNAARNRLLAAGRSPRILTTGHSLGGALAIHAGLDLARQFSSTPVHCYTFAAPRVGNRFFSFFAMSRMRQLYHVVNYQDPVPLVPPIGPKLGPHNLRYDRMAETWYINRRGVLRPNIPYGTIGASPFNHAAPAYSDGLNAGNVTLDRRPRRTAMR